MSSVSRYRPIALLIAGALLLVVTIVVGFASAFVNLRERALMNSERELRNMALVLAAETERLFQALDLVQTNLVERIASLGIVTNDDFARQLGDEHTHRELEHRARGLAQVDAITLIDAGGQTINSSRYWPVGGADVSDRAYFKALKANPELVSIVTDPVRNRGNGAWTIYLARRVTGPQGQFLGLVLGAMELSSFEKFFSSIALVGDAGIAMFRSDGTLLVRHPRIEPIIGRNFANGPLFQNVLRHNAHGVMRLDSRIDGQDRLVAAQVLKGYPLAIAVSTTTASALASWRYEMRILAIAAALAILLIVFVTLAAAKQVLLRNQLLQQQIATHKRHLDTAIENMSQGLLLFDASERLVLFNRRYIEMYGLSPDVVKLGCSLADLIRHRQDTGTFVGDVDRYCEEIQAAVAQGRTTNGILETADGRSIHIVNQPLPDGGWLATHEDITAQRQAGRERDENRQFLNLIIENVPAAIAVRDAVTRKYVLINRAAADLWKFDHDDVIGRTPHELFPKSLADAMTARDEVMLEADGPRAFDEQESVVALNEVRIVKSQRLVVRGEDGKPKYLVSVLEDVTERRHIQQERDRAKEFLDMIIENVPAAIAVKDARTRKYVLLNRAANEMWSVDRSDVIGKTAEELFDRECADIIDARDAETLAVDHPIILEDLPNIATPDDGRVVTTKRLALRDERGEPTFLISVIEDVTERHRAQAERDRNKEFLDLVIENVPSTIVVKDAKDLRYALVNKAGEKYFGMPREKLLGLTAYDVWPRETAERVDEIDHKVLASRAPFVEEHPLVTNAQELRTVLTRGLSIRDDDGTVKYIVTVIDDITHQKEAEAKIAYLAYHDALTGLPNRLQFRERLEQELAFVRRGGKLALLYLDLDHFKGVNDTLGHSVGDELLQAVAGRLRECLREGDIVARLGGDEFAVLQTGSSSPGDAAVLAQRLRDAIAENPYELNGHHVVVDVSVGIALAPSDGHDADQLLRHADLALYGAKADGRGGYRYFEPDMDARMKVRRSLEVDLRSALADNQFQLHYQPLVDSQTNKVSGCEALLRWYHPERGLVPPAEFVPIAEETGLINPIGEWVLRQACTDAAGWPSNIKVAVNLSPVQIKSQNLTLAVASILAESGLSPQRLELEITESVLMQSNETNLGVLHLLRELGVRFAMDDFGTGYSSLSYLRSFPFDKIKIDRSFIGDLSRRADSRKIVQAIVTLARGLGMITTAEGVETEEQLKALRGVGCDEIQGFLVSVPRPAREVEQLFRMKLRSRANVA